MLMDIGTVAAITLVALSAGYAFGARSATTRVQQTKPGPPSQELPQTTKDAKDESESEEEDLADGDLASVKPGLLEPCKLVSPVNRFLINHL